MAVVRRLGKVAAGVSIAALVAGGAASTAQASAESPTEESSSTDFCTYDMDAQKGMCYPNDAAAKTAIEQAGDVTIMKLYGKPNYRGKSFRFTSNTVCRTDPDYKRIENLSLIDENLPPGQTWNNRVSSIKMHRNCWASIYAKRYFRGHHSPWLGDTRRLGRVPDAGNNWNNAASSILIA